MRSDPSKFHDRFAQAASSGLGINQSHGLTLGVAGGSCEGSILFGKQRFPQEIAKLIFRFHGPIQPNQCLYFPPRMEPTSGRNRKYWTYMSVSPLHNAHQHHRILPKQNSKIGQDSIASLLERALDARRSSG